MPDITRNSFDESKTYRAVAFQRNRDVLDSELNELQDVLRVAAYRDNELFNCVVTAAGVEGGPRVVFGASGAGVGLDFAAVSGTADTLVLHPGEAQIYGYRVKATSPITISGLTTPAATRTDTVWVALQETWVDSSVDPNIAVGKLGETTQRRKLLITFGVTEGGEPTSTGEPWMGLIKYTKLGTLYRTHTNTAFEAWVDQRQMAGNLARASDRGLVVRATSLDLSADNTTLTIVGLAITDPTYGDLVAAPSVTLTCSDDKCFGWSGEGASRLRRTQHVVTNIDVGAAESATTSPMVLLDHGSASCVANDCTFWLGRFVDGGVVLFDGTTLSPGDRLSLWRQGGEQVTVRSAISSPTDLNGSPYLKKYREGQANHTVSVVDYLGFQGMGVSVWEENYWGQDLSAIAYSSVPTTPPWSNWTYLDTTDPVDFRDGNHDGPTSFQVCNCLKARTAGNASGVAMLVSNRMRNPRRWAGAPDTLLVIEWLIGFGTTEGVPAAGKQASFSFGLVDMLQANGGQGGGYTFRTTFHPSSGSVGNLPTDQNYWVFFCDTQGAWYASAGNGSATSSVSLSPSFTPTVNATHKFRLEVVGSVYSGGGEVRFWVDDILRARVGDAYGPRGTWGTGTAPPQFGLLFGVGCASAGSGPSAMYIGPVKAVWKNAPQT